MTRIDPMAELKPSCRLGDRLSDYAMENSGAQG